MDTLAVPSTARIENAVQSGPLSLAANSCTCPRNLSLEERASLLIIRDLLRVGWQLRSNSTQLLQLVPPISYEKDAVKRAMAFSKNVTIDRDALWIKKHLDLAKDNLANGREVLSSPILPRMEVCESDEQHNLFRILRYHWSSPPSDYIGRRIRLLIRDDGLKTRPIIGIAALGSSIIHIPERDKWIGWNTQTRSQQIIYMMDAYVVGALPPYNHLLGGKLISYLLASNEIRRFYKTKYIDRTTVIKGRNASELVLIMTTSLYGRHSSQYNRISYNNSLLYLPIGMTAGYGSLHISNDTFAFLRELVEANGHHVSNRFGKGPNWRMRVIRTACEILKLNSDVILRHSFQKGLFALPLAENYREFLNGNSSEPVYRNLPLCDLVSYWQGRWHVMRSKNEFVVQKVKNFSPCQFTIGEEKV